GGQASRAHDRDRLVEQGGRGRLAPGPGPGPHRQLTQPRQQQREGVLGHWLGVGALRRGPLPLAVDDAGLGQRFHPRQRQLHPDDLRVGREHPAQVLRHDAARPDQAHRIMVQGDGLSPAAADGLGGPGGRLGRDRDPGVRPAVTGAHRIRMSTRSLALVWVGPVTIASPHASRTAVVSWATSAFRKLIPCCRARSPVDQSTRPPAFPVPPSEPSVSANIAAMPWMPSRASAAPIAASWLGPPRPNTRSASGPRLTVHSPPQATRTVPGAHGEPLALASRASVASSRPTVPASPSTDPPSRTTARPRDAAARMTASLPSSPRTASTLSISVSLRSGDSAPAQSAR